MSIMEQMASTLPFEDFETFYNGMYEEVYLESQDELLVVNPNEVTNEMEMYSEEYVIDDIDHEEFTNELGDISLSELVNFPEDLKDFGIDIMPEAITSDLASLVEDSMEVSVPREHTSVPVQHSLQPVTAFSNEVEVVNNGGIWPEETNSKSAVVSDSEVVDVETAHDVTPPSPVRPVVFANKKKFIPSKAYGMVCPNKKTPGHATAGDGDDLMSGVNKSKREAVHSKKSTSSSQCNKKVTSSLQCNKKTTSTAQISKKVVSKNRSSKGVNGESALGKVKAEDVKSKVQKGVKEGKSESGEESAARSGNGEGKGSRGESDADKMPSKEELDRKLQETVEMLLERRRKRDMEWQRQMKQKAHTALQAFQNKPIACSEASSRSSKGATTTASSQPLVDTICKPALRQPPCTSVVSMTNPSEESGIRKSKGEKKMTSILNLSKFNSSIHHASGAVKGSASASTTAMWNGEGTTRGSMPTRKVVKASSSSSLSNYSTVVPFKAARAAVSTVSVAVRQCGSLSCDDAFSVGLLKSRGSLQSGMDATTAHHFVAAAAADLFTVDECHMDEGVMENVVVTAAESASSPLNHDMCHTSPQSSCANSPCAALKGVKKKISLSDYRKMSRSHSFSVEKSLPQAGYFVRVFDHTATADHNYCIGGSKRLQEDHESGEISDGVDQDFTNHNTHLSSSYVSVTSCTLPATTSTPSFVALLHDSPSRRLDDDDATKTFEISSNHHRHTSRKMHASSNHPRHYKRRSSSSSSSSSLSSSSSSQRSSSTSRSRSSSTSSSNCSRTHSASRLRRPHFRSRSRSSHYSRSRSRESFSCSSDRRISETRSDHSERRCRSRRTSSRQQVHNNAKRMKEIKDRKETEIALAGQERRIIYVGFIKQSTTRHDLESMLQCFGRIVDSSVHIKPSGDCYGFVTYEKSASAARCKQEGNRVPGCEAFDFGYGGRRHFCASGYDDLDRDADAHRQKNTRRSTDGMTFEQLLAFHSTHLNSRSSPPSSHTSPLS